MEHTEIMYHGFCNDKEAIKIQKNMTRTKAARAKFETWHMEYEEVDFERVYWTYHRKVRQELAWLQFRPSLTKDEFAALQAKSNHVDVSLSPENIILMTSMARAYDVQFETVRTRFLTGGNSSTVRYNRDRDTWTSNWVMIKIVRTTQEAD